MDILSTTFTHAFPPAQPTPGPALWLVFSKDGLLLREADGPGVLHRGDLTNVEALCLRQPLYLGTLGGFPCLAADFDPDLDIPEGWSARGLRSLYAEIPEAEYTLAGYAMQMLYWRRTSGFCPVCGHRTEPRDGDWGRFCPECGHIAYPHVTPATLILVYDGPRLLLAHKPGWGNRYSILAGFVESGESLEECVRREAMEETGLKLTDLAYAGSQPWPYPHQLMIGFTARHAGGDIQVDGVELDHADWFTVDTLPELPSPVSLSRKMIDEWIAGQAITSPAE